MMRVLTVQDLSCLGKCSLTVALPVLPTAVLSTHTASPFGIAFEQHLRKLKIES